MKLPLSLRLLIVVVLAILVSAVALATLANYLGHSGKPSEPSACGSIIGQNAPDLMEQGLIHICGDSMVSDGKVSVTVHNYYFSQTKDIDFHFSSQEQPPLPNEVSVLVNLTVDNVGGGNTTIGGGWESSILNGSSWISGTNFIANASFPNTFPNQTLPDANGGIYLPPASSLDLWVIFYISFSQVSSSNIDQASNFSLQYVIFRDLNYGGIYEGQGSFNCQVIPCQNPNTELIIKV